MGKQVNFYMSGEIEKQFIDFIFDNGNQLIESKSLTVMDSALSFFARERTLFYFIYKKEFGELEYCMTDNGKQYISAYNAPVIELIFSNISHEKKKLNKGRLWLEMNPLEGGYKCEKSDKLNEVYKKLKRWINKNVPKQELIVDGYTYKKHISPDYKELVIKENYIL